jgi:acyl carrier protein
VTRDEVEARCRQTFAEILELDADEVGIDDDFFSALDGDSLQKLDLVVAIEQEFGTRVPESEARDLNTVRLMTDAVVGRLGQGPGASAG